MNGIQEVVGSIPSSSTTNSKGLAELSANPFFVYSDSILTATQGG